MTIVDVLAAGDLLRVRSVGVHDIDVEASVLVALVGDALAVGAPRRTEVRGGRRRRELTDGRCGGGDGRGERAECQREEDHSRAAEKPEPIDLHCPFLCPNSLHDCWASSQEKTPIST